ncbi:hypothetical protein [Tenacibaculum jejuense]|uniref:Uncharacterized protein n=1 Tax=Tenacibaculum jejuense TaxID=584609 RepID=A0A238UF49_9FLAO|nr:hypothetical protein [Tenacibaculum jejuense]SNR17030.1 protein of unknown function [Tenacibaculum jejuense]
MQKKNLITFYFIVFILGLYAQKNEYWKDNWKKITITDDFYKPNSVYFSSKHNKCEINRNYELRSLVNNENITTKINSSLIDSLFLAIQTQKKSKTNPLQMFNKDSDWLASNAEELWGKYWYRIDEKKNEQIDSFAITIIKDYKKNKNLVWSMQGEGTDRNLSFVRIQIITEKDTLNITSTGKFPYMLPWYVENTKVYNSDISTILSKIIPDEVEVNKEKLLGTNFNFTLLNLIKNKYLKDRINYIKLKKKYKKQFKYLEKEFVIKRIEESYMSSVEWEGIMTKSLEIELLDKNGFDNIEFYTIFNANFPFSSSKSIVRNKNKLLKILENNPVFKYSINCENCVGEIHWVKSKSFSRKAKEHFIEDLINRGADKNKYKGRYKDAIFFELTEERESGKSISRWIFLKDGTLILWELEGNYLMNLSKELMKERGFVCLEIKKEEFDAN